VHDYLLSTEVIRFAFVLGVAVSMLMYERRHLTTGSIVVPGYIAVFIVYPLIIVATFVNAILSYLLVNKVLRRWFLLYGRTKFTILALVSIAIQTLMLKLTPSGPWLWESDLKLFVSVGYVVPALVAHDMGRQGVAKTFKSVVIAAAIVATPIALALALNVPGINDLAPLQGTGDMAIDPAWIPVAVFVSAAAAWGVAHNYDFRSGGFVGAAFIGMLLGDPWQVAIAVAIALVTYVAVTRLLMTSMILFGRRKFSAMLLVSSALSWCLLWTGTEFFDVGIQQHLDLGSLALTPLFIPGLLANDAQRTSPLRVAAGVVLAGSFAMTTTWWTESLFEGLHLAIWWKLVAVASFGAIFWRQFFPARVDERRPPEVATPDGVPAPIPAAVMPAAFSSVMPVAVPAALPAMATTAVAATDSVPEPAGWAMATTASQASPPDEPTAAEPAAVHEPATGRAGFERWAAAHRDAADAAERWLSAILGESDDTPSAAETPADDGGEDEDDRFSARVRRAAARARSDPNEPETDGLPIRQRPRPQPSGEFDAVATGIAAGVRRPKSLPRRERGAALVRARQTPVSDDVVQAARVQLELLPEHQQFSETPESATRAHQADAEARDRSSGPTDTGIGPIA
jgi:poly-gamma-glutamate biosynthesis protein PgsC/CapC